MSQLIVVVCGPKNHLCDIQALTVKKSSSNENFVQSIHPFFLFFCFVFMLEPIPAAIG